MRLSPWKHLDLNGLVILDSPSPQLHKNSTVTTTQTSPGPTSATWSPENEYFFEDLLKKDEKKKTLRPKQSLLDLGRLPMLSCSESVALQRFCSDRGLFRCQRGRKNGTWWGKVFGWVPSPFWTLLPSPAFARIIQDLMPFGPRPNGKELETTPIAASPWSSRKDGKGWERMGKDGERWKRTFSDSKLMNLVGVWSIKIDEVFSEFSVWSMFGIQRPGPTGKSRVP